MSGPLFSTTAVCVGVAVGTVEVATVFGFDPPQPMSAVLRVMPMKEREEVIRRMAADPRGRARGRKRALSLVLP
jgi:hypothetical protein